MKLTEKKTYQVISTKLSYICLYLLYFKGFPGGSLFPEGNTEGRTECWLHCRRCHRTGIQGYSWEAEVQASRDTAVMLRSRHPRIQLRGWGLGIQGYGCDAEVQASRDTAVMLRSRHPGIQLRGWGPGIQGYGCDAEVQASRDMAVMLRSCS